MQQPSKLPWWWNLILLLLFVAGATFVSANWQFPPQMQNLSQRVRPDAWSRLFGIWLVSIASTHFVTFRVLRRVAVLFALSGRDKVEDLWSPTLVGICESIMYPTALMIGKAEFIGVWLAVRVAGQWVRWAGGEVDVEKANEGRRRFNRFLVGNAISIMAAAATYGAMKIWALK